MIVSSCCGSPFYDPGWPDNDICSDCREHADPIEEEEGHKPLMTLGCEEIVHGPNDPGDENDNIIMTESDEANERAINKVSIETSKENTAT